MQDVFKVADHQLAERRDLSRKQKRRIKREVRAMQYRQAALRGGGERERERRVDQIGYGRLRFENGLVFAL